MELKPNMYVRTHKGTIHKIMEIDKMLKYKNEDRLFINEEEWFLVESDITKASYNIIDLIEVGDYVNGEIVGYIDDCDGAMREYYYNYEDASIDVGHWCEEIKSIVTKEQFSSMEYRLGDK